MQWIAGVRRNEAGQLKLLVQDREGNFSNRTFREISKDFGVGGKRPRMQDVDLSSLRLGCTRAYLQGLNTDHLCADGQPVYEAEGPFGTLLIPAQLLIYAIFGRWTPLRAVLLTPLGASSLKVAIGDAGAVKPHYAPYRQSERTNPKHAQLDSRLTWIQGYPSATSAWGSVFRNALSGKFDMTLPLALATLTFSGKPLPGKFLVTKLQVSDIKPYEQPHPFACDLPVASRTLPARKTRTVGAPLLHDPRIAAPDGEYVLTDEQWSLIEPLVTKPSPRTGRVLQVHTYPRKDLVEAMLTKFGTPIAWFSLQGGKAFAHSARVTYDRLKKSGVWDEIVLRLQLQACDGL